MSEAWTQGPWEVTEGNPTAIFGDGRLVALAMGAGFLSLEQIFANARLMSKAPELVDVLDKLLEKLKEIEKATAGTFLMAHRHGTDYKGPNWAVEVERAAKLLAMIRGGQ